MGFNALHGLFLFLPVTGGALARSVLFQCPSRAFLISTMICQTEKNFFLICFNALHGLFLFLQDSFLEWVKDETVSMPFTGFSYFYASCYKNLSAGFVFQCPSRAFLISTATSANPCKHCLPGPVFAGIYLNILTNPGFREIFGMFTLCSYFSFSNCIVSVHWIPSLLKYYI